MPIALEVLGNVLRKQNRPAEALGYYMEADALFRKSYPPESNVMLNCRQHMAETMIEVGQTEEGNRILNEVLQLRNKKEPPA